MHQRDAQAGSLDSSKLLMVWGRDFFVAHKCKKISATSCSLDTSTLKKLFNVNDDTITIVRSNRTKHLNAPTSMAVTAWALFGNPLPQYLNALTIATNQTIADTGTSSIFIMEGANIDNKSIALSPQTINLPDSTKVWSTHVCNITIPGLPTALTGHIVHH
jgi:hypothetical protein